MTDPSTPPTLEDDPPVASAPSPGPRPAWRSILPVLVILVIVAGFTLLVILPTKQKTLLPGGVHQAQERGSFDGGTLTPLEPAPATTLRNYLGQTVTLSQYRGKAVLVTFLYTHCPDVCPLIASNLRAAQVKLGAENAKVQMLVISVDPRGDTPRSVAEFLRVHRLTGRIQYLIGSAAQLGAVWSAWNVGSQRDAGSPALVSHSALVYGISATGDITTIYPANFAPSDIAHDVPLLVSR